MKNSFLLISFVVFLGVNAQNITYIDLTLAKIEQIPANRIFKEIICLPLETHMDGLIDFRFTTYYLNDKYIIANDRMNGAFLFNREKGTFIREISSRGQGPDDYLGLLYKNYAFDEKNSILFVENGNSWKCINIETNKVESIIKRPITNSENEQFKAFAPWLIKDDIYLSFCNNSSGKNKIKLVVFDKEGTLLKKYQNYAEYNKIAKNSFPSNNGIFYYYNDHTFFKEYLYNDTVFCVDENSLSPHIIFKLGERQPSYYHQEEPSYNKKKYLINFVYESDLYVLFSFVYYTDTKTETRLGITDATGVTYHTGYYDKISKQAYISSTSDFKQSGYIVDGIPICFSPFYINNKNEMITQIDPEELIKYKDVIGKEYLHLFQNTLEDDNPIVVIAKLKE